MNAYLPGRVAEKFNNSRMVIFSMETSIRLFIMLLVEPPKIPLRSLGEYAQPAGRERYSSISVTAMVLPMLIYRLNYAIDLRYGNLLEIGKMVYEGHTIDLSSGHMNVIWQGDANEIRCAFPFACHLPPKLLNVTGPETNQYSPSGA